MKKLFNNIRSKLCEVAVKGRSLLTDRKGEVAVNTIGAIIIAVVVIGLLVVAIRAFFPNFFTTMFQAAQTRLNRNW
jgi:hypothetical protein